MISRLLLIVVNRLNKSGMMHTLAFSSERGANKNILTAYDTVTNSFSKPNHSQTGAKNSVGIKLLNTHCDCSDTLS